MKVKQIMSSPVDLRREREPAAVGSQLGEPSGSTKLAAA
jgi:hypothetical protein